MTEERNNGMTETSSTFTVADVVLKTLDAVMKLRPHWQMLTLLDLLHGATERLRYFIKKEKGVAWDDPFLQLDYEVKYIEEAPTDHAAELAKCISKDAARSLSKKIIKRIPDFLRLPVMEILTRDVIAHIEEPFTENEHLFNVRYILPPEVEAEVAGLPEEEREAKLAELIAGFDFSGISATGTADTPTGKQVFAVALAFAIRPLIVDAKKDRAYYPILVGLNFTEGDPSVWSDEDREALFAGLLEGINGLAAPYLKELEEKGETRPAVPQPDHAGPIRDDYFKAPGRLFDTPRHAAKMEKAIMLPTIDRWYSQTAFNRTVGMAAAALTNMDSRDTILDEQSATVAEVADLVYWREEIDGTPSYGQNREDIVKAFEALRAIPIPIVRINWKRIGTERNPRYVKEYKLRTGSMLQSWGAVFVDKKTGKRADVTNPAHKKNVVKGKPDRRKKQRALVAQSPADDVLQWFPADRYTLTGFEWRWNTDIVLDFICPQVALDEKNRPRLKLKGGRHIEGSRFINLNRRYFAVMKHLREAGSVYGPRLLDLIVSEKTHITSRGNGAVWIEIQAEKVIKLLDLWTEYQVRPKHVLEDHVMDAIILLIKEKVLLPESWLVPQLDKNPDRRKTPFFRWKVAEEWTTVALVTKDEANIIEGELIKEAEEAEAAEAARSNPAPEVYQIALPGMDKPPAEAIPSGKDIREAREAAGMNLRDFARMIGGPDFSAWSRYENGKPIRVGNITPDAWTKVRNFIEKYCPKGKPSHDGQETVT